MTPTNREMMDSTTRLTKRTTVIFSILIKTPPYHLCTEVKLVVANFHRKRKGLCSPLFELAVANPLRLDFNIASPKNASPFFDKLPNLYSFMINCTFWAKTFSNLPDTGG